MLSEFLEKPLHESFYLAHRLKGINVADPFMGGGTPLLEANRLGCEITGFDINPMAYWIVKQEIEHLDLEEYLRAAYSLREQLEKEIGHLYRTRCVFCGNEDARHPKNVFLCHACGQLTETSDRKKPGDCRHCGGWANIIEKFRKAKAYCDSPFEIRHRGGSR
ncbi:MAG: hypothetical protein V2B19_27565 [Pseudomonadota bacterium]